jgi:hypothetical protein
MADIYVKLTGNDANSGLSWATAKQTIAAGIAILEIGETLHIGFGDYSAQSAVALAKNMSLLCETADTGGGTGTAVLPIIDCETTCQLTCQSACQVQPCQVGCEVTCQTTCEVSCQTACQLQPCQTGCEITCQTTCELACQDTCQLYCQVGCEVECQDACEYGCQTKSG